MSEAAVVYYLPEFRWVTDPATGLQTPRKAYDGKVVFGWAAQARAVMDGNLGAEMLEVDHLQSTTEVMVGRYEAVKDLQISFRPLGRGWFRQHRRTLLGHRRGSLYLPMVHSAHHEKIHSPME